ncbi:alpha-amylase family protein [Vibrio agarilyticus]|nr:alpha-amylase family protein [Vibrio agarilyticus]
MNNKKIVYQVFTRLFGNTNTHNVAWGTIEENGVGKFSDFTDTALNSIKALGITHIWYTGVPHHALVGDYQDVGITCDHPAVVKGRAGSPYAVKDYYNVNPDLAQSPAERLEEFKALIDRSHKAGLKVVIDIVPNHVARNYHGLTNPLGVEDFGASDDTSLTYHKDNNFYYLVDQAFELPTYPEHSLPLGGRPSSMSDVPYVEKPARWSGNGARKAKPEFDDWYETVKINYGVRPDGTKDFPSLPNDFEQWDQMARYRFWQENSVPDSWRKFRHIAEYWLMLGVDGFRYDMAELVPVEFWSYLNTAIKHLDNEAFLMAEVYQPALYRDYIQLGGMDCLYDKVDLYDTLKGVIQGKQSSDAIANVQAQLADIDASMLRFLDNHDEQRLASPQFAGDANFGKPAMLLCTALGRGPALVYFGQEVGEPGEGDMGFGRQSRTSIYDYCGVPAHQRWMNGGQFDGGQSSDNERQLRAFYQRLLNLTLTESAFDGDYVDLHVENRQRGGNYDERMFAFARSDDSQHLLIFSHFSDKDKPMVTLHINQMWVDKWQLQPGEYWLRDRLAVENSSANCARLSVTKQAATLFVPAPAFAASVFDVSLALSEVTRAAN